jgi:hypothetical protein
MMKARTIRDATFVAIIISTLITQKMSTAFGVPLSSGQQSLNEGAMGEAPGVIIASTIANIIYGPPDIRPGSNVTELVVRRTGPIYGQNPSGLIVGGLDFYLQMYNDASSFGEIHQLNTNFYGVLSPI